MIKITLLVDAHLKCSSLKLTDPLFLSAHRQTDTQTDEQEYSIVTVDKLHL